MGIIKRMRSARSSVMTTIMAGSFSSTLEPGISSPASSSPPSSSESPSLSVAPDESGPFNSGGCSSTSSASKSSDCSSSSSARTILQALPWPSTRSSPNSFFNNSSIRSLVIGTHSWADESETTRNRTENANNIERRLGIIRFPKYVCKVAELASLTQSVGMSSNA